MTATLWLLSLIIAFRAGWTGARYRVGQRKAAHRELAFQLRNPLDLHPCEYTTFWEAQR